MRAPDLLHPTRCETNAARFMVILETDLDHGVLPLYLPTIEVNPPVQQPSITIRRNGPARQNTTFAKQAVEVDAQVGALKGPSAVVAVSPLLRRGQSAGAHPPA